MQPPAHSRFSSDVGADCSGLQSEVSPYTHAGPLLPPDFLRQSGEALAQAAQGGGHHL